MRNETRGSVLNDVANSKFLRSIFIRIVFIFLIVIISIIAIVFFSFTSEINKNVISERQKQLETIENTISKRMEEISSIAYNVSTDEEFFLENVSNNTYTNYEMTKTLDRYLVGNDFIEYVAYYRLSDADNIYTSNGEFTFHDFWNTYLNFTTCSESDYLEQITSCKSAKIISANNDNGKHSYITYINPLPQFSNAPQAFVIMLIPTSELVPILEPQLNNCSGMISFYDTDGVEIYGISNLDVEMPDFDFEKISDEENIHIDGKEYILQKKVSKSNSWTYLSIIRLNDIISEVASKQIIFIALLLILMCIAITIMLRSITTQYKPISALARSFRDNATDDEANKVIDEQSLLSETLHTLKDDSDQKQHFETAYNEATAASKAKSAFLSNMSHDIRTPMNAIVGMTEIAIRHFDNPDYVKDCLQNIRVASQYLLDIINNVLDMSRIESGKFTLSEDVVDLPKLIHETITILNHNLAVKSQKLVATIENISDEKVIGDAVRLTQVFMNILSNSLKFTPTGGTIRFQMKQETLSEDGYGDYIFIFSDTGIGMSPEFVAKVFDTFTRDENANLLKVEGTGLGMAIAKSFVDLMGGSIKCESEINKGTTFTIRLHMKLADSEPITEPDIKDPDASVLIFGQEQIICENELALFNSLNIRADYALTLNAASDKIKDAISNNYPYDFVIINQTDEDKNGINTKIQLAYAADDTNMTYILAAWDVVSLEQSLAVDAGIAAFVQIPLFKSTAIALFNRSFELKDISDIDSVVDLTGMNILLVEDNNMNRQIARALISDTHASLYEAVNGKEAVDSFNGHEDGFFDIILMDVQMPVMNGYEATLAIRSLQRADANKIPIIAMTANTFDEDVRQVKETGMNGHLGKPYSSDELYAILAQAFHPAQL